MIVLCLLAASLHAQRPAGTKRSVPPVVAFLGGTGMGALEITGDFDSLVVRGYAYESQRAAGTSVPASTTGDAIGRGDEPFILTPIDEQGYSHTNIGFAETAGEPGLVRLLRFGSLGQRVAAVQASRGIGAGASVDAVGVETSNVRRTSLGVSEIDGPPVTVRIAVSDARGVELGVREVSLPGRGLVQLPLASIAGPLALGSARFTVIGGGGRVLA